MSGLSLTSRLLLRHGCLAWPLVRLMFALALLMTNNPPLPVGGTLALGVVAVSVAVAVLAMGRRGERVLLANLGIGIRRQLLILALPAALLEMVLAAVMP